MKSDNGNKVGPPPPKKAQKSMENQEFMGRPLKVNIARPKEERAPHSDGGGGGEYLCEIAQGAGGGAAVNYQQITRQMAFPLTLPTTVQQMFFIFRRQNFLGQQ